MNIIGRNVAELASLDSAALQDQLTIPSVDVRSQNGQSSSSVDVGNNMKSKYLLVLLTLRAAAFVAGAGFVASNATEYFLSHWGLSIASSIYALGAFAFIWGVLWLSTRNLLRVLKADAVSRQRPIAAGPRNPEEGLVNRTYSYPSWVGCLVGVLGLVCFSFPFVVDEQSKGNWLFFGLSFLCLLGAAHYFIYSVTITIDTIIVKAFTTRKILIADIVKFEIISGKGAPEGVIKLRSGKRISFGGRLKDFTDLSGRLKAAIHKT
jgi:hypothetical protein